MGLETRKTRDLRRDPRILVHSIVCDRNGSSGEFKLRGRALACSDNGTLQGYAAEVTTRLGWQPEVGRFHLFAVDVEDVTFIRWVDVNNDQYITRWPEGGEVVRRGTSATSTGPPEAVRELLV